MDEIEAGIQSLRSQSRLTTGLVVSLLLVVDLFFTIPSTATIVLSGHLLGFWLGGLFAAVGVVSCGLLGYLLGRRYGEALLHTIVRNPTEQERATAAFKRFGPALLLVARAVPMLPEITSCLAGVSKMPVRKFLAFYCSGTLPYVAIATAAGVYGSIDNPLPAVVTLAGLNLFLWVTMRWLWTKSRPES